jgi:hypothetical protein
MAQDWVVAYGILTAKEAEKLLKKIANRENNPKSKVSSNNIVSTIKSPEKLVATKRARTSKSIVLEDGDAMGDDNGALWEGRGTSGI